MINRHDIDDFNDMGSFIDGNGHEVQSGDVVEYKLGKRQGIVKDILQDGDAYVKFNDTNQVECVKWTNLCRIHRANDGITW